MVERAKCTDVITVAREFRSHRAQIEVNGHTLLPRQRQNLRRKRRRAFTIHFLFQGQIQDLGDLEARSNEEYRMCRNGGLLENTRDE
jgi:hypothetical protein